MQYLRNSTTIIQPGGRIFQVKLITQTVIFAQLNSAARQKPHKFPIWRKPIRHSRQA